MTYLRLVVKLNARLDSSIPEEFGELQMSDILQVIRIVINLKDGIGQCDDIDHLGNRRVRSLENWLKINSEWVLLEWKGQLKKEWALLQKKNWCQKS